MTRTTYYVGHDQVQPTVLYHQLTIIILKGEFIEIKWNVSLCISPQGWGLQFSPHVQGPPAPPSKLESRNPHSKKIIHLGIMNMHHVHDGISGQSDQLAPLLEGRPSCPSICPSLASSPSFGGASGFIPLKLFKSAKSPKKIAGGTGIIFKFNVGTWPGVSQISSCVL